MKFEFIKNLELKDLLKKSEDLQQKILDAKMKLSMQRLSNPLLIRNLRRDRARVSMAVRHRLKKQMSKKTPKDKV